MKITSIRAGATHLTHCAYDEATKQNYSLAITYLQDAIELYQSIPQELMILDDFWLKDRMYSDLGQAFYDSANYKDAITAWETSLKLLPIIRALEANAGLHRNLGEDYYDGYLYSMIADSHYKLGNMTGARHYNDLAINYFESHNIPTFIKLYEDGETGSFAKEHNRAKKLREKLNSMQQSVAPNSPVGVNNATLFGSTSSETQPTQPYGDTPSPDNNEGPSYFLA